MHKQKSVTAFLFVLISFLFCSNAWSAEYNLAWPDTARQADRNRSGQSLDVTKADRPYEKRLGSIRVASGMMLADSSVKQGDIVIVTLFGDASYRIELDSVRHLQDGTSVLSGKGADDKPVSFTLTSDQSGFLMTVKDLERNMTYRASGTTLGSLGNVTEIDMKLMPPVIHLPPVVSGKDGGR